MLITSIITAFCVIMLKHNCYKSVNTFKKSTVQEKKIMYNKQCTNFSENLRGSPK